MTAESAKHDAHLAAAAIRLPERFAGTEWAPPRRQEEEEILSVYPPAMVIDALSRVLQPERTARLDAVASARIQGVVVVLENLYDPHNGGAALRSCESMGLLDVQVIEGTERFRVARKITQGCDKWLEITRHKSTDDGIAQLRRRGLRLYAAVPGAQVALEELPPLVPCAFLIGNEHAGLSAEARAACDQQFAIPLHGFSQSVNLSVATALCVYTHTQRRRQALGRPTDLSEAEVQMLRARYYIRDLRGARAIVERHAVTPLPLPSSGPPGCGA